MVFGEGMEGEGVCVILHHCPQILFYLVYGCVTGNAVFSH